MSGQTGALVTTGAVSFLVTFAVAMGLRAAQPWPGARIWGWFIGVLAGVAVSELLWPLVRRP